MELLGTLAMVNVMGLGTLDRDLAARRTKEEQLDETKTKVVPENKGAPSTSQLLQLCLFVAVPFFGFGFADNANLVMQRISE
eukprot:symbB.v1.2.014987.t1/scaffold1088.1/size139058/1